MADGGFLRQQVYQILEQRELRDAMRVLNDEMHNGGLSAETLLLLAVFRVRLNSAVVLALRDAGNDEDQVFQDLPQLVVQALLETLNNLAPVPVPAPATAVEVISLEKQTFFRAAAGGENDDGDTECSICLKEFVDGGQVSVMPCPSRVHKFHPDCISKWLEMSNTCPLCRHELPTADAYDH